MSKRTVPEWADDLMGAFNLIDLVRGVLMSIRYRDLNPHRITIPHPEGDFWERMEGAFWNGNMVRDLLVEYGVRVFWFGFNGKEVYWHITNRQARWAEYICLRAGVPLQTTYDFRNVTWAARHSGPPPSWRSRWEATRKKKQVRLWDIWRLIWKG